MRTDIEGVMKKYGALSVLNQSISYIVQWLADTYGEDHVHFCTGMETQTVRNASRLPKDHDTDAFCIACIIAGAVPVGRLPCMFEIVQFCRHNRANINNQRERTYRLDGKIVCRNRHKRFEQKNDSLEEFRQKYPDQVSHLTVAKSIRYYNDADRLMPSAVFIFEGERHVMQGQLTGGRYYRAVGCGKRNFPATKCTVIKENAGLVYI
jgi:hydrogenase maturation factor